MQRYFLFFWLILIASQATQAQTEVANDSTLNITLSDVKEYDGFLLDMGLMNLEVAPPSLNEYKLVIPDASKDYSRIFRLNPNISYSQGYTNLFQTGRSTVYGSTPFGWGGFWSTPSHLMMSSFKLKNGMRLNTYGQYNREGFRMVNPSALPWERNNFKGAFELKSANGNFGIRIEVERR